MAGFNRFLMQLRQDAKQWLFFMLVFSAFRLAFLFFFRSRIEASTPAIDIVFAALNGLRFDSMVSTYWILIPFLASATTATLGNSRIAETLRTVFGVLFVALTSLAWVLTFPYFKEYGEQFNYFIFNLYYDDADAILKTIWADYHPIPTFLGIGIIIAALLWLRKRFVATTPPEQVEQRFSLLQKVSISLLILILLVVASRGSIGRRPAQRKDIGISKDEFLNKAVVNPFFALHFAIQDHAYQTGLAGLETFLPDRNVRKAAQEYFNNPQVHDDLDAYLLKHAAGPKALPPRHIFLVVMESYDAWPFQKKYASLGLTSNLSRLARNGVSFENFLPASDGTMQSLTAIMTGIPYPHVEINYQMTARTPYPSSLAETFKRLGYKTRLFYGGFLSWQRFGDFARDQGFTEVYGAPHMAGGAATHEWGVDDEFLFDFVQRTADDSQPSFNLIMTTSYHPPYTIDVWSKGFPLKEAPPDLAPLFDGTATVKMLGHLWYSDKCIGDFVSAAEKKLPRPLFAFTGDHFGRKFINAKPDAFERSAVPFILYGPESLKRVQPPAGTAGAHIDIGATIVELAAPRGFPYYSMGRDLLAPRNTSPGIGFFRVNEMDYFLEFSNPPRFHALPGKVLPEHLPEIQVLRKRFDQAYGIAWWRVRQGKKL